MEEIEACLGAVEGLESFAVIPAPFPHGASGKRPFWEPPSKFLQSGILNLAGGRFLGKARGVLSVDIDELIWSKEGRSVFDEAAASPLGYLRISGSWVFPAPEKDGPYRHRDHTYMDSRSREGREKWCVVPEVPSGATTGMSTESAGFFGSASRHRPDAGIGTFPTYPPIGRKTGIRRPAVDPFPIRR